MGGMKRKHQHTLELIFARPVDDNLPCRGVEDLFLELGAEVSERTDSLFAVMLIVQVRVFHRHNTSRGNVKDAGVKIHNWFEEYEVTP